MAISNDQQIADTVRELDAFISSLPTGEKRIDEMYASDYQQFLDRLESLTGRDLGIYRLSEGDIRTADDEFAEMAGRMAPKTLPDWFNKPMVVVDRLRTKGSRVVSLFHTQPTSSSGSIIQHINFYGDDNNAVVGFSGGDLNQNVEFKVGPGDDSALISGLEALKINQETLDELKKMLEESSDPDSKKSSVRMWAKSFTNDVMAGVISGEIASQAPAAFAMALAYLS